MTITLIVTLCYSIGITSAGFQTSSWNSGAVENSPPNPTVLTFDTPIHLNYIETYHWNYGNGVSKPGTIGIKNENGNQYGPWQATGRDGSGGVQDAIWRADADVSLPAGTYTIIDSDPETWSHNKESGNAGFALLQYDKSDVKPHVNITRLCDNAFVLNAREQYQEAEEFCNQALALDPSDPDALSMKGWALLGRGRYQEALDAIDASLNIKPDDTLALSNKACALYEMERCQEASQTIDYAYKLDPSNSLNKKIRQLAENCYGSPLTKIQPTPSEESIGGLNAGMKAETPTTYVGLSCDWTGTWETNWGEMVLQQTGNKVTGTYVHDQGRISGTISDNILTGTWSEAPSYSPTNDAGDVELTLAEDCRSFEGRWRYGSEGDWSEGWTGKIDTKR